MSDITRSRILETAELLLRRHGPAKLTVTDVARHLGMSHANVYRHFASKADLLDAVAERWLRTVSGALEPIALADGPAAERLEGWAVGLWQQKRRKISDDPEHFAMYHGVAEAARGVVARHVETLLGQLERILADGAASGEFQMTDPPAAARAVWNATVRFHHPHLVTANPACEAELQAVLALVTAGLRTGAL
ncbi:MAG: TetR family transcriptional regulator [Aphanocapsa lilacina HA4352-LM1]|nr:TetR family transcriptional regulator [Aphanocapsa lilacina HA4352-LM1]